MSPTSRSPPPSPPPSSSSAPARSPRGEVLLLPPDALRDGPRRALVVGDAVQPPLRSRGRPRALPPVPGPARVRREARLGRPLRQRASPELLRDHAEPKRDGGHAGSADEPGQDRD